MDKSVLKYIVIGPVPNDEAPEVAAVDAMIESVRQYFGGLSPNELTLHIATPIVLGVMFFLYYTLWRLDRRSHTTVKSVTRLLRKNTALREWKVLTDVRLSDEKGGGFADQAVVGPFGVLLVRDLHRQGGYYGDKDTGEWILSDAEEDKPGKYRVRIPNPLLECQGAADVLRRRFIGQGLGKTAIHILVVTTQAKAQVYIPGGDPRILTKKQLGSLLQTSRFTEDRGVDVERVAKALGDAAAK